MKAEKTKSPLVEKALAYAQGAKSSGQSALTIEVVTHYLKPAVPLLARSDQAEISDLTEGIIKAVRSQRTEWHDITVDDSTTGILICSSILDADIWLALRDDFAPDPELPSFAIFYLSEIPLLKDKTQENLRKIHKARLIFNGGKAIPAGELQ